MLISNTDLRDRLNAMLAEGLSGAIERERTEFDRLAGAFKDSLVLFGAAKLGRKTLAGLRSTGVQPLAFADSNPELWGTSIEGVPVLSPLDAAQKHGKNATFVVTIWGYPPPDSMRTRKEFLQQLGCRTVISFVPLFWKYADFLLPHNALDLPHKVQECRELVTASFHRMTDRVSQQEFLRQLAWRVSGDFEDLNGEVDGDIYFVQEIGPSDMPEVFIDCGAYDGDTILRFLQWQRGPFKCIYGFEPDPLNWLALNRTVSMLPTELRTRICLKPVAVGEMNCRVSFRAEGTLGAAIGNGSLEIDCVRLDDALEEEPTFIKMDLEGGEPEALRGSRTAISRSRPVIAACSYHLQEHLWSIPALVAEMQPESAILLRQHKQARLSEELVCYAIPQQRYRPVERFSA